MTVELRLAITADLHWGHNRRGNTATEALRAFLGELRPDVFLLGGDVGTAEHFDECLALFADLSCPKALVPGNHDLWVREEDARGDSLQVYREHLPTVSARYGFHYLDHGPLLFRDADLAIAGSINWYDYSWAIKLLPQHAADWEERLRSKRFSRGRHNDGRFVRWPLNDVRFTAEVVAVLQRHLDEALGEVGHAVVVTHHPAFHRLGFPHQHAPNLDSLLWDAFCGNAGLEAALAERAERIPFVFSGHTHQARENRLGNIQGYNVGGDYHFKRLIVLHWPRGEVEAHIFGEPARW